MPKVNGKKYPYTKKGKKAAKKAAKYHADKGGKKRPVFGKKSVMNKATGGRFSS